MRKVKLAACSLSQWAMDFEGNLRRILESVRMSKDKGARYRIGPELEITGYGCNDHFLEDDTLLHSWESLVCILENKVCENIIIDVGMPVMFQHVVYNCRVIILNKKILLIRPKKFLAGDGNYREQRWFSPWTRTYELEELELPPIISKVTGQRKAPFGDALIRTGDSLVGCETCEELFVPSSPHTNMALQGVEIFTNSSGSYHELRKLNKRIKLISEATSKNGGIYVYANLKGCDGERVYYDGSSLIFKNGDLVAQGEQFSLEEIEVVMATVDLDDVKTHRRNPNFGIQSGSSSRYKTIDVDFNLVLPENMLWAESSIMQPFIHLAEEEIALGPACWLWDYLRRSGCGGFFLPLSGGIDSSSTACIVASMCRLVCRAVNHGNIQVLNDIRNIVKDNQYLPSDAKELCNRIFVTCYMGTENSSEDTKERAKNLARDIGSYHLGIVIDTAIKAMISIFINVTNKIPRFRIHGGTETENLALQNIQARTRMVLSYLFAQLTLWSRGNTGSLLVLGSANVDESLLGYMTKYDCSSADLNPIGGISKTDLKKFVFYCVEKFDFTSLIGILGAQPTAELEPLKDGQIQQADEEDIGLTYSELSMFGRLRKIHKCGPFSMFMKLITEWHLPPAAIAEKVKIFFRKYAINRHKMTVVTPAYHAEGYSPDDNRFDLRPFLYRSSWPWQFRSIDRAVANTNKALITSHIDRSMTVGNSAIARELTQTTLASNPVYQTRNSTYVSQTVTPSQHPSPPIPPTHHPSPPHTSVNIESERKRIKLEPL